MAALAATLRLARPAGRPEGFCLELPEAVQALLDVTDGIWSDGSSSSSSEEPPQASRSSTAPLPALPVPPPGLEGERVVRRVSRQKLQVPGQTAAARRSNFLTTPATSGRSVTISHDADGPRAEAAPRLLPRSFTTEPARSHEATQWSTEQLRQQMAQLQHLQQLQLQQISQYDLQQQRALLQQFQMTQMQQMRAQSLREPTPQRPSTDVDPKALRRTVSAAPSPPEPSPTEGGTERAVSPAGGRRRRKSMRQVAQEVTAPADSEAEMQLEAGPEDVEIIVGPTEHAVLPLSFEKLWINDDSVAVRSRSNHLSVSDVLLLKSEEPTNSVRSFGSLLHSCRTDATCRPCMFERVPGRCKKAWLCDFCHLHSGRKKKKGVDGST